MLAIAGCRIGRDRVSISIEVFEKRLGTGNHPRRVEKGRWLVDKEPVSGMDAYYVCNNRNGTMLEDDETLSQRRPGRPSMNFLSVAFSECSPTLLVRPEVRI